MLTGRLPRQDRPGEVAVNQLAAASLHVHVGSRCPWTRCQRRAARIGYRPRPSRRAGSQRVVGIVVTRSSVEPVTDTDKVPFILASSALRRQLGPGYRAFDGAYVKLAPGPPPATVSREAQALARRFPATQGQASVADESAQVAAIERSIRPEAVALAIFALVLACTALLIVGQAATRLLLGAGSDNPVLAALGMTRGQLSRGRADRGGRGGHRRGHPGGRGGSRGVAADADRGRPARRARPRGQRRLARAVRRRGDHRGAAGRPHPLAGLAARLGARDRRAGGGRGSGTAVLAGRLAGRGGRAGDRDTGARLAMEPGRGRTAVPVRAALAGTTLSVLAVTAAFTFGANLLHLVHSPRLYGQAWDAAIDLQFSPILPGQAQNLFGTNPGVTGWTYGDHGIIGINGHLVPAIGLTPGRGPLISPTLLAGRPPRTGREIVLGSSTLHDLGLHVGQEVPVTVDGRQVQDRIVGQAVFPELRPGQLHADRPRRGRRDHRGGARPAGRARTGSAPGSRWCCCVSPAAPAGVRRSPGSAAP